MRPEREEGSGDADINVEARTLGHARQQPSAQARAFPVSHRSFSSEPRAHLKVVVYVDSRVAGQGVARRGQSEIRIARTRRPGRIGGHRVIRVA